MISENKAKKFADPHCKDCQGDGWVYERAFESRDIVYCHCAKANMAEHEAEMREE